MFASLGLGLGVAVLVAAPLAAQDFQSLFSQPLPPGRPRLSSRPSAGGVNKSLVPIQSFVPVSGGATYSGQTQGYYSAGPAADVTFWAPLSVPVGVNVDAVCLEVFDNDDAETAVFYVAVAEAGSAGNPTPGLMLFAAATTGVGATPGFATLCAVPLGSFTFPLFVRLTGDVNGTGSDTTLQYYLLALAPATRTANAVMLGPAVVTWSLPDAIFEDGFQ
jgi:hypothetical protein